MTNKVQIISAPPPREYTRLKSMPGIGGASKIAIGSRMFISMNHSKPPFDDVNFRLAVSRALDRQKIASQFFGLLDPTAIPAPTDSWWFNKEANSRLDFNLAAAKELLAKSKYASGASFDLLLPAEPYLVDVKDAALICAAQKVEHYEMAGYGCARTFAQLLGLDDVADLLQETLDEEGNADKKLTEIAETAINVEAASAEE